MMTQGGTAGMGVPAGKSYLDAMADQSNMLLARQIARGNSHMNDMANIQKGQEEISSAMTELITCVQKKKH